MTYTFLMHLMVLPKQETSYDVPVPEEHLKKGDKELKTRVFKVGWSV